MDIKTVLFLLLALLFGGQKQLAVSDNNGPAANSPYDLGEIRLMSDANKITPRYKKIGRCLVVAGIVADCQYHDWNGISYVVFEGKVVRIEADREFLKKGARLPFGLAVGDDREVVVQKLLRYRNVAGLETLLKDLRYGKSNVSVAVQDKRLGREDYQFYLVFDGYNDLQAAGVMISVL